MPEMPMVLASRHGELSRNVALLNDLAAEQPLSPTAFSLSVHNALLGVWTILRGETTENVAVSSRIDGLEHAFLEAQLLLAEGHAGVLVIATEDAPPPAYAGLIDDTPHPYIVTFLVQTGPQHRLDPVDTDTTLPPVGMAHPLSLVRHLLTGTPQWRHAGPTCTWQWKQRP